MRKEKLWWVSPQLWNFHTGRMNQWQTLTLIRNFFLSFFFSFLQMSCIFKTRHPQTVWNTQVSALFPSTDIFWNQLKAQIIHPLIRQTASVDIVGSFPHSDSLPVSSSQNKQGTYLDNFSLISGNSSQLKPSDFDGKSPSRHMSLNTWSPVGGAKSMESLQLEAWLDVGHYRRDFLGYQGPASNACSSALFPVCCCVTSHLMLLPPHLAPGCSSCHASPIWLNWKTLVHATSIRHFALGLRKVN